MPDAHTFVVVWADATAPLPAPATATRLRSAAVAHGGDLLALSRVGEVFELATRAAPPWAAVARFEDPDAASGWYHQHADALPGSAVLVPAPAEPIWWPERLADERPDWSERGDVPADRLGLFVSVWITTVNDLPAMVDYSTHFRWTIERHGGLSLALAATPTVLAGHDQPLATTLLSWPSPDRTRTWYETADYRSYRTQRHQASEVTIIAILAFDHATVPPRHR